MCFLLYIKPLKNNFCKGLCIEICPWGGIIKHLFYISSRVTGSLSFTIRCFYQRWDVLTNKFIVIWLSLIFSVYLTILFNILLMLHILNPTMCLTESFSERKYTEVYLANFNLFIQFPLICPSVINYLLFPTPAILNSFCFPGEFEKAKFNCSLVEWCKIFWTTVVF